MGFRKIVWAAAAMAAGVLTMGAGDAGWLGICSKCMGASITSATGLGTAHAAIKAKVGVADAQEWCGSWQPDDRTCVKEQMASDEFGRELTATADCTAGKMTTFGENYVYAGLWDNSDIGGGRSKWRGADGKIVGRSNAEGGLGLAQHWESLCPKGLVRASAPAPAASRPAASALVGAVYAVGQEVEAKYMSGWVRARVVRLRPGANGAIDYEVNLANGQRGIVPARMLRPLAR